MSEIQPCPICGCCVLEEDKQRLADYAALRARMARLEEALRGIEVMADDERGNAWELAKAARRALEEK